MSSCIEFGVQCSAPAALIASCLCKALKGNTRAGNALQAFLAVVALGLSCDSLTSVTFLTSAPGAVDDDMSHTCSIHASSVAAMWYYLCTSGLIVAGTRLLCCVALHLIVSSQVTCILTLTLLAKQSRMTAGLFGLLA